MAAMTEIEPKEIKINEEIKEHIEEVEEYLKKERNDEFMYTTLVLKLAKVSGRWRAYKDAINDNLYNEKVIANAEIYHESVFNIMKRVREELEKESANEVEEALKKRLLKNVEEWDKAHLAFETSSSNQS